MAKKFIDHRYLIVTNRCRGDSIRRMARRLDAKGYEVERTLHKTTLLLRRPKGNIFSNFESDITSGLHSLGDSAVVCSTSGRQWMCRMVGNRPGDMVRLR